VRRQLLQDPNFSIKSARRSGDGTTAIEPKKLMSIGSSAIYSFITSASTGNGESEIAQFLSGLATEGRVSASTQNQALNAILFLYNEVLSKKIGLIDGVVRAKRPQRLPVVLTKDEVKKVLDRMNGTPRLMGILLYGAGLRLMECCRLRIKDIDFTRNEVVVRPGKGNKDRYTMLPSAVRDSLIQHLRGVKSQHDEDLEHGLGRVSLPNALDRKYPNAGTEWGWQWVFPATSHYTDRSTGEQRRHHLHESVLQRAFKEARLKAGVSSQPGAIRFVILSRLICWRMVTISERFKSCWGTMT
jgi:integron integrase